MTSKRLARLALLAYPRALRASKGEEIVGTLLDASGTSNAAYARELVALIGGGLRVRARTAGRPGAMRLIADGFCYAGVGMLVLNIALRVGERLELRGAGADASLMWMLLLLAGCLSAALIGYDRIAGAGALLSIAINAAQAQFTDLQAAAWAVPAACFAVMLVIPRRQPRRIHRAAWLIPTVALGIAAGGRGPSTYLVLAPLAVVVPLALVRLARDPRLAIACALLAATIAVAETADALQSGSMPIGLPLTILLFTATPLTIAFAARRPHPQRPDS
jgi:hypothetical protein